MTVNSFSIYLFVLPLFGLLSIQKAAGQKIAQTPLTTFDVEYPCVNPVNGHLLYSKEEAGKLKLFEFDGKLHRQYLRGDLDISHTSVSTNGELVAFTYGSENDRDIIIYHVKTSQWQNITKSPAIEFHPKFTSDGKHLVYNKQVDTLDLFEIMTYDIEAKSVKNVYQDTSISRTFASFSPDMEKLACVYWHENMNTEIYISDADGQNAANVSNHELFDGWPCWSPDGNKIVFASDREEKFHFQLYVYDLSSQETRQITEDEYSYYQPAWHPDGERIIAVKRYKRDYPNQIVAIPVSDF